MSKPISKPTKIYHHNLNKFNYSSQAATGIAELLSSNFIIRSLQISSHGKTGVIFIETDSGAFVLKSSNDGPKDEFLNRLAVLLHLHVPQSICYCCSDPIFKKIVFSIQKFCQRDQILYTLIKTRLDFPFYQILQYIPSISLAQIGKDRFKAYLLEDTKLYSIGMCLAYDMIINNSDRFQLVWNSDGNINNVLIQIMDHHTHKLQNLKNRNNLEAVLQNYVYIDHSGYLLDLSNQFARKNFDNYIRKVCDLHVKLIRALGEDLILPDQFNKLKRQVELYTHYSLTDYDMRKICHGIIYLTNKFLQIFQGSLIDQLLQNLKKKEIDNPKKRVQKENTYWYQYWNQELLKVNLGYLQEVYIKIAAIYTTYPQTIQGVLAGIGKLPEEQVRNPHFDPIVHNPLETEDKIIHSEEQELKKSKGQDANQLEDSRKKQNEQTGIHNQPNQQLQNKSGQSFINKEVMLNAKLRRWRQKLARFKQQNNK